MHLQPWPVADEKAAAEETVTMVVQVNGKVRARLQVPVDIAASDALEMALAAPNVERHIAGARVRRVIDRRPRLLNLVVST